MQAPCIRREGLLRKVQESTSSCYTSQQQEVDSRMAGALFWTGHTVAVLLEDYSVGEILCGGSA